MFSFLKEEKWIKFVAFYCWLDAILNIENHVTWIRHSKLL